MTYSWWGATRGKHLQDTGYKILDTLFYNSPTPLTPSHPNTIHIGVTGRDM